MAVSEGQIAPDPRCRRIVRQPLDFIPTSAVFVVHDPDLPGFSVPFAWLRQLNDPA